MPLTETGKTVLTKMTQTYHGDREKAKRVFYAKANKSKAFAKAVGEMSVRKRAGKD